MVLQILLWNNKVHSVEIILYWYMYIQRERSMLKLININLYSKFADWAGLPRREYFFFTVSFLTKATTWEYFVVFYFTRERYEMSLLQNIPLRSHGMLCVWNTTFLWPPLVNTYTFLSKCILLTFFSIKSEIFSVNKLFTLYQNYTGLGKICNIYIKYR